MEPTIETTRFGSISIGGTSYAHDVLIRLDGQVVKRKKSLSKAVYGTSHQVSLAEAQHVHEEGARRLVVGAGQFGLLELSPEAARFFEEQHCRVTLLPTGEAIEAWNHAVGAVIGLFHITC